MSKEEIVAVIIMNLKTKKVLMQQRAGEIRASGLWEFPGGHLESNETYSQCGFRESKAETDLTVKMIDTHPYYTGRDIIPNIKGDLVIYFMRAQYIGGTPRIMEPHKCAKQGWFSWGGMPRPTFPLIEELIAKDKNPFKYLK